MAVAECQHMTALAKAQRIRVARAALKAEIAAGTRSIEDVLLNTPEEAQTMAVMDLLRVPHRWGRQRARRFLISLWVPEMKPLGELTDRQRRMIVAALKGEPLEHDPIRRVG